MRTPVRRATFFGEPPALGFLAFTEAWERFSYYGMTSLLALYMTQALFMPAHIGHVAGFAAFRAGLESVFGRMGTIALASQINGLYTGFVYFTPVFGGWLADRFIGRRNAVMLGAILMSAGHFAMAFDASFLLALVLLIVGCGFLKGNISTQVGELYPEDDHAGRTRGFSIFSIGINVGAVAGPLACALLAQIYGWHAGFGLAGVLMLLALATYSLGYRHLREGKQARRMEAENAPLSRHDWITVGALIVVMALTIPHSIAYYQNANIGLIWISANVDLNVLGFHIPVGWFNSIDSFVSIVSVPPLFALWRYQAARGGEPGEIAKIATGAFIAALANLVLVIACMIGGRPSGLFPVFYDVLLGVAFLYYWPTLLALVSRAAPQRLKATMMGAAFLSLFLSNITLGRLGSFYEQMSPAAFWAMNVAIAASGGTLALLLRPVLARVLDDASPEQETREAVHEFSR
ncbi:MAG TPA: peptide MFS transporter [Rhizomicrobium sp.]|nr:peptide MFS transporter [Rhizomicrobium sp.]